MRSNSYSSWRRKGQGERETAGGGGGGGGGERIFIDVRHIRHSTCMLYTSLEMVGLIVTDSEPTFTIARVEFGRYTIYYIHVRLMKTSR